MGNLNKKSELINSDIKNSDLTLKDLIYMGYKSDDEAYGEIKIYRLNSENNNNNNNAI